MSKIKYLLLHLLLLTIFFIFYRLWAGEAILPDVYHLSVTWDAMHYYVIAHQGYFYDATDQSNVAFFPAFPYLWRFSGLNSYGISILNIILFYIALLLLARHYQWNNRFLLLALSLPPMFYMYVPYSEALFFLSVSILLIGMSKNKLWLIIPSLFIAGITRSAGNIFLPAFFVMGLVKFETGNLKRIILLCFVSLVAVFLVAWLQFSQTGEWLGFVKTQKQWGHHLQWPQLPFRTWGKLIWLDAAALASGIGAIVYVIYLLWERIKNLPIRISRDFFFSFLYLAGATAFAMMLKGGNLFSLNRYLIPTPFFVLALAYMLDRNKFRWKELIYIFFGLFIFFVLFHFFAHIRFILMYLAITVYLCLYFFTQPHWKAHKYVFILLYLINCFIQVYLLDQFLNIQWVG